MTRKNAIKIIEKVIESGGSAENILDAVEALIYNGPPVKFLGNHEAMIIPDGSNEFELLVHLPKYNQQWDKE